MKFKGQEDRTEPEWIYKLAQTWLETGQHTDMVITCVEGGVKRDFPCHKIMMLPFTFLTDNCPAQSLEETEHVILADVSPAKFKQYLNLAYGLCKEELSVKEDPDDVKVKIEKKEINIKVEKKEYIEEDSKEEFKVRLEDMQDDIINNNDVVYNMLDNNEEERPLDEVKFYGNLKLRTGEPYIKNQIWVNSNSSVPNKMKNRRKFINTIYDFDRYLYMKDHGTWHCRLCSCKYNTNGGRVPPRLHVEKKHFPNTFTYTCPNPGCLKEFPTCKDYLYHKSTNKCKHPAVKLQPDHEQNKYFKSKYQWVYDK